MIVVYACHGLSELKAFVISTLQNEFIRVEFTIFKWLPMQIFDLLKLSIFRELLYLTSLLELAFKQ
jgi:hypothetical protein